MEVKDIPGYEHKYAITKEGNVWAYPNHIHSGKWLTKELIKVGYYRVTLSIKGKSKRFTIHRLVACNLHTQQGK